MLCKRCPHLVRHGQVGADKTTIEFSNICGLLMRAETPLIQDEKALKKPKKPTIPGENAKECKNFPFPKIFDYMECQVYQGTFKSASRKNDVIPTQDFQYSDVLSVSSITDMELL